MGFPGETEEDFQSTLDLVTYGRFDMIYIGIYSPRPGTFAAKNIPDDIPYIVKHQRRSKLNELLKQISQENNKKEIGNTRGVLINEIQDNKGQKAYIGHTDNMKQIILESKTTHKPGDFVQAKISK